MNKSFRTNKSGSGNETLIKKKDKKNKKKYIN